MSISYENRKVVFRWTYWFMLFNWLLAMGIGSLYLNVTQFPDDVLSRLFLLLSFPTHFFTVSLTSFLLVMLGGFFWPKKRLVIPAAVMAGLVMSVLLLIDAGVFSLYRFHLNGMVLNLVMSGVAVEVLSLTWGTWVTFLLFVVGVLLLEIFIAKWLWRRADRLKFGGHVFCVLVVLFLTANFIHAWADYVHYAPVTRIVRMLPAFKPLTMRAHMERLGFVPLKQEAGMGQVDSGSGLLYPLEKLQFKGPAKPYNLMIIVIDSWRFDMLSPITTPNIWKFAAGSTVFEQHYSAGNATRFGIFSLLYGLYGTYWHSFLAEQRGPVLISELNKRAYEMGIFASAPLTSPEFDLTVFKDVNETLKKTTNGDQPVDRDLEITRNMVNFINKTKENQPFFGFLFYDAPHAKQFPKSFALNKPYIDNLNYLTLNKNQDPQPIINTYKNSLRFVDSSVAEVLAALQRKGKLDNTVVLITGDHGEEFNDLKLGYWGHNGNFAQYQTRTPLVLHFPGQTPHQYNHLTTHLDVVPTLMRDMFGATTAPSKYSNGTYLTDTHSRQFVLVSTWASFAMVEPKRICIVENRGSTEIVDCNYTLLNGETLNPQFSKTAIEEMGKFYKH